MKQDYFNRCNRRQFSAAGISMFTASQLARSVLARGPKEAAIIDTHLHCFAGESDPRFPYHTHAPYRPEDAATPGWLLKCMRRGGVDGAVVVGAAVVGVAVVQPATAGVVEYLEHGGTDQ